MLNQESSTRDDTGLDFSREEAARYQASNASGEIPTSDLQAGKFEAQIEDEADRSIATFRITGTIEPASPG